MEKRIEKKKKFIINFLYASIIILLFFAFFKYAFGLFVPFIAALLIATVLQRPLNAICKNKYMKRGPVSAILVLLCFVALIAFFVLLAVWAGSELKGFIQYLLIELQDIPRFIESIEGKLSSGLSFLPEKIGGGLASFISEKLSVLLDSTQGATVPNFDFSILSGPLASVLDTAKQIPMTLVAFLVSIVSCCFMTADFANVKRIILSLFRTETREKVVRAKRLMFPTLGKMARAYGIIITITFCELSLGLFLLKLIGVYNGKYLLMVSFITAIIDIVPVLGTGTVLVPWALFSILSGEYGLAIGLFVLYGCITVIRQIIEPKLVASQLGIPPFATIMAMFIGTKVFGFIGLFLLPLTLVMVKLLNDEGIIHIFHKDEQDTSKNDEADIQEKATVNQE